VPRLHGDPRLQAGDAVRLATAGLAAIALSLAAAGSARAQSWEASFLAGYTPNASLDRKAPELDQLDVAGGFTLGVQAGHALGQGWSAEVLWTRQDSALRLGTSDGKADLFSFTIDDLHGDAVYHFAGRDARLRPFVFGGLGATFFSGGGLPSETKFSWSL